MWRRNYCAHATPGINQDNLGAVVNNILKIIIALFFIVTVEYANLVGKFIQLIKLAGYAIKFWLEVLDVLF